MIKKLHPCIYKEIIQIVCLAFVVRLEMSLEVLSTIML